MLPLRLRILTDSACRGFPSRHCYSFGCFFHRHGPGNDVTVFLSDVRAEVHSRFESEFTSVVSPAASSLLSNLLRRMDASDARDGNEAIRGVEQLCYGRIDAQDCKTLDTPWPGARVWLVSCKPLILSSLVLRTVRARAR